MSKSRPQIKLNEHSTGGGSIKGMTIYFKGKKTVVDTIEMHVLSTFDISVPIAVSTQQVFAPFVGAADPFFIK